MSPTHLRAKGKTIMAKKPSRKVSFAQRMGKTLATINTPTFKRGFSTINLWVSSSNFAMNRLWSGSFKKALLFGRNYVFYGESGSGKSLMCAIIAGDAQREHGAYVVWLDIEHATDDDIGKKWLERAGIDTDPEKFEYISCSTLEEIKTALAKIALEYQAMMEDDDINNEDIPPIIFVVDSWAAALTSSQWEKAGGKEAGKVVGDMGQKAKQTGDVINAVTHLCAGKPIMVLGVQHIMDNQDGYGRKHKTTGGNKMIYYASGCLMLTKSELDDEEVENPDVIEHYKTLSAGMSKEARKVMGKRRFVGINATMEILKSRVSKPFERVEIQIPYLTGIDPYSGLFHLLQQEGVITSPTSGWYEYADRDGKAIKFRKRDFLKHADLLMELAEEDIAKPTAEIDELPNETD